MNLIICSALFPPEIAEPAPYIKKLSSELLKNQNVSVLSYANNTEKISGLKVIKAKKEKCLISRIWDFRKALIENSKNCDLVLTMNSLAVNIPSLVVARKRKIPLVIKYTENEIWKRSYRLGTTDVELEDYSIHQESKYYFKFLEILQSYCLRQADFILCPTDYIKNLISEKYSIDREKILTLKNPGSENIKLDLKYEVNPNDIIIISKLNKNSGIDEVIRVVSKLSDKFPKIKLNIIGDGIEKKRLIDLSKKQGVSEMVRFLGEVSQVEKEFLLKKSGMIVINSEKLNNSELIKKAFSLGVVVIAKNNELSREVIKDWQTGVIVNHEEDLLDAVEALLVSETQKKQLVKNAEKLCKDRYSWENHTSNLEKIFGYILKKYKNDRK